MSTLPAQLFLPNDPFPPPRRANYAHALVLSPHCNFWFLVFFFSRADKVGRKAPVSGPSKTRSSSSKRGLTRTKMRNFPQVKVGRQRQHCQQQRMTLSYPTHTHTHTLSYWWMENARLRCVSAGQASSHRGNKEEMRQRLHSDAG